MALVLGKCRRLCTCNSQPLVRRGDHDSTATGERHQFIKTGRYLKAVTCDRRATWLQSRGPPSKSGSAQEVTHAASRDVGAQTDTSSSALLKPWKPAQLLTPLSKRQGTDCRTSHEGGCKYTNTEQYLPLEEEENPWFADQT